MERKTFWWSLLCVGVLGSLPAYAGTSVDVRVRMGDAPPPPVVVVREEPRVVVVPGSTVYVVDDDRYEHDCFRYGVYWYIYNDGYWYRARTYRGPFVTVGARYVPRAIITVPAKHWKHHPHGGPPGLMKKDGVVVVKERGKKHGRY